MNYQQHSLLTKRTVALILTVAILLSTLVPRTTGVLVAAASTAEPKVNKKSVPENDGDSSDDSSDDNSSDDDDDDDDEEEEEDYEPKIQKALLHHATEYNQLLERSLQEGAAAVAKAAEIGPDGNVVVSSSDNKSDVQEELWRAEFALHALERELAILDEIKSDMDGESGDGDYFSGDGDDEEFMDDSLRAILDGIDDEEYREETYEDIREEFQVKRNLDPEQWYTYNYWQLHAHFSCSRVFAASRPAWGVEKWSDIRQYWREFVEEDKKDLPIREGGPERSYQFTTDAYDFDSMMQPFQTPGKGRGLKAAKDILKGEMVFKGTNNTVIFTHGHTWRKFLFALNERRGEPFDDETSCDVLVWSWVQTLEEDGDLVIVTDFDNGSLLNEGRDEPGWEAPNVRCGKEGDKMCYLSYYATKDIKKGEELLCDYRGFALLDSWHDMGL